MPGTRSNRGRRGGRRRGGGNRGVNPVDRELCNDTRAGMPADTVRVAADLHVRPINGVIIESPPKNLRSKVFWYQTTVNANNIGVGTSGNTESNYSFILSNLNEYTSLTTLFDQYCIYSVVCNISVQSMLASSNTNTFGRVTTAIDYDNVSNLGGLSAVQDFGNQETVAVVTGLAIQRYIKPCNSESLYTGSFGAFGVGRFWIDCASTGVQHYGLRTYWSGNTAFTFNVDYNFTYVMGFRNSM